MTTLYGRGSRARKRGRGMDLSTRRAYIRVMADTSDLTYELLKRMHAEFGDFRRDLASIKMRLGSVEQQQASVASDIARISLVEDEFASVSKISTGHPADDFSVVNEP